MKHLKKVIEEMLFEICENVFLEMAEDDSPYPYLVYNIGIGVGLENMIAYSLDIDIWDKSENTIKIDDLARKLKKLDDTIYIDENVYFSMHFNRILNAGTKDREWKRYTITFDLKTIERN